MADRRLPMVLRRAVHAEVMLVTVPETITEAINAQPVSFRVVGTVLAASTVREVPYSELYRQSTSTRETPAQRLQRVVEEDPGLSPADDSDGQ